MGAKLIIGYFAGAITIAMQIPQLYHTIRTKKTKDISMWFLLLTLLNHIFWLTYAVLDNSIPLMVTDTVGAILTAIIIGLKIYYDHFINQAPEDSEYSCHIEIIK